MNQPEPMLKHADPTGRITVKFIIKNPIQDETPWRRQLPDASPTFGRCDFTFDPEARAYDWLVVYDELPTILNPLYG